MSAPGVPGTRTPVLVLVSGSGTLLQAVLDAQDESTCPFRVVAVGADRADIDGLRRAERHGVPTFVQRVADHPSRAVWDAALADSIAVHRPSLVVSAGFMKLLGPAVLRSWAVLNAHPALLPSFPGAHAVRDALAHGVRVTGCTVHLVDDGVDTGPILAQQALEVAPEDTEETLHERIKVLERSLLVTTLVRVVTDGLPAAAPGPS